MQTDGGLTKVDLIKCAVHPQTHTNLESPVKLNIRNPYSSYYPWVIWRTLSWPSFHILLHPSISLYFNCAAEVCWYWKCSGRVYSPSQDTHTLFALTFTPKGSLGEWVVITQEGSGFNPWSDSSSHFSLWISCGSSGFLPQSENIANSPLSLGFHSRVGNETSVWSTGRTSFTPLSESENIILMSFGNPHTHQLLSCRQRGFVQVRLLQERTRSWGVQHWRLHPGTMGHPQARTRGAHRRLWRHQLRQLGPEDGQGDSTAPFLTFTRKKSYVEWFNGLFIPIHPRLGI